MFLLGLVTFVWVRVLQMKRLAEVKERMAADLHDELGATLHTIGLLSDLAEESKEEPKKQKEFHRRIRSETERSGKAVRRCVEFLDPEKRYESLVEDMTRAGRRILADIPYELKIEGEEYLENFSAQSQYDLFLFFKECLVNMNRHANATSISLALDVSRSRLVLRVRDDGRGIPDEVGSGVPHSLSRRAKILRAKLWVESAPDKGTSVTLTLKARKRRKVGARLKR